MYNKEQQLILEKNKTLLLAALDYYLKYYTGSMVFDDFDPSVYYYLQEKKQTEKDFQESNLEALQRRLDRILLNITMRRDLNFEGYMKAQTEQETTALSDESVSAEVGHVAVEVEVLPPPPNTETNTIVETESTSRSLTEAECAEFQRQNGVLAEAWAPNGISRLITQTNAMGDRALTSVSISLAGGAGAIYAARGASLPINAYWKITKPLSSKQKMNMKQTPNVRPCAALMS